MTFMSNWRLLCTVTVKQVDTVTDAVLVWLPVKYSCTIFATFVWYIIKHISMNTYVLLHSEHKMTLQSMSSYLIIYLEHDCLQSKRFMRATLTLKFLLQYSNAEWGGLETAHKDSRQMFQYFNRMFQQILQISFKISFDTWAFQTKVSRL